jgi:tetratricopeptide (TPR) repeat protein
VLAAAAVIGRSFAVDTVRAVSGRGDEEAVAALEELVARGLVRERASDYDFAHEQLRTLAYEEAGLARRRLLHGRAADALRRDVAVEAGGRPDRVADAPGRDAAAVARHLALAGREAEAAVAHARAAEHARSLFANAQALEHLDAALALGHPEAGPLHAARGDVLTLLGEYGAAGAAYETAAALAAPADLAGIEHRLGRLHHRGGDLALAEAHLTAALAAAGEAEPALRSQVHADLSLVADDRGEPERAAGLAAAALELAERADDPRALGRARNLLGVLATGRGEPAEARAQLEQAYALGERTGDLGARVAALNNLALARRTEGDLDQALALAREALELCAAQGDRHREAALRNNVADLLHEAGRADEAMAELKRAVTLFAEIGSDEPAPGVWKLVRW